MNIAPINTLNTQYNKPNFQGVPKVNTASMKTVSNIGASLKEGMNKKWDNFIDNIIIDRCLKPIMNSKFISKFADKTVNIDNMPSHMATAGSIVTTYFYANRTKKTLNKDEEQRKRAKTLALNQWMVTAVSTAGAYGLNDALGKISKNLGYKFREANQGSHKLATRMKGFDIAKQLLIFTMMYRYVAPVLVTPIASKVSKLIENHKANKTVEQKPQPSVQTPVQAQVMPRLVQSAQFKALNSLSKSA